ncbi:MAG: hypothetical protein AAF810_10070 [Cyanobacteria bacterium P01_D01_bin.36]
MDSSPQLTTTRKQLQGYGASRYLARKLTVSLPPVAKSGNAYVYGLHQVIAAIRTYNSKPRIQLTTKQVLEQILTQLLPRLDNVTPLISTNDTTEVSNIARQLLTQMHRTEKSLAEVKATAVSIGKYKH